MTRVEADVLQRVVATNGGGLRMTSLTPYERKVVVRLHLQGLVQGKSGQQSVAVHTQAGLEASRGTP